MAAAATATRLWPPEASLLMGRTSWNHFDQTDLLYSLMTSAKEPTQEKGSMGPPGLAVEELAEKLTFSQRLGEGEGESHMDVCGRAFSAEGMRRAKVLNHHLSISS